MGNKCFKRKSSSGQDDVPNNQKVQKNKKASRYAMDSDGAANEGFVGDQRVAAQDGNFTNLATVPVDGDGHIIHLPGEEQVRIEWANGPNSERPVDVPADQLTDHSDDEPMRNNHAKPREETVITASSPKVQDTSSVHSVSSKGRGSIQTDSDYISREGAHPLAEPDVVKTRSVDMSDDECKSLSDISIHSNDNKQEDKAKINISADFQTVRMANKEGQVPLVPKTHDEPTERQRTDKQGNSSHSNSADSGNSDSDSENIQADYPDTNYKELVKRDGGYDNPIFHEQLELEKLEQFTPQHVEVLEPVEFQVTTEIRQNENKEDSDSLEANESDNAEPDSLALDKPEKSDHDSVIQSSDNGSDSDSHLNVDTGNGRSSFHFKSPDQSEEADRELSEITMEIEQIEESLAQELLSDHNAEELSRKIVETLDEITALRDQSEILFENESILEEDVDDDIPMFRHPGDVIQWYNTSMDDLNEKVGMALLELSMLEDCDNDQIRQQFQYHRGKQCELIRKKINYSRHLTATDTTRQSPSEARHSHDENTDMIANYQEGEQSLSSTEEQHGYTHVGIEISPATFQQADLHDNSISGDVLVDENNQTPDSREFTSGPNPPHDGFDPAEIDLNPSGNDVKPDDTDLNPAEIDLHFSVDHDNLASISEFDLNPNKSHIETDMAMQTGEFDIHTGEFDMHTGEDDDRRTKMDIRSDEIHSHQDTDNFESVKEDFNKDIDMYSYESPPLEIVHESDRPENDLNQDINMYSLGIITDPIANQFPPADNDFKTTIDIQDIETQQTTDNYNAIDDSFNEGIDIRSLEIKPLEDINDLIRAKDDFKYGAEAHGPEIADRLNVAAKHESDSSSDESESNVSAKQYEQTQAKRSANVEVESSEEEPQIGVNQFATPYKSEDDLWSKVERLSSQESYNAHLDLEQDDINFLSQNATEVELMSDQGQIQVGNDHDVILPQETEMMQAAHEASANHSNRHKVTGSMMYESSESESDEEVKEPQIVPRKRSIGLQKQAFHYDNDSDIEEMEVNYQLIEQMHPKTSSEQESPAELKMAHQSSESDSEVEELVNRALRMEEESSLKVNADRISQNTDNESDVSPAAEMASVSNGALQNTQAYEDYSEKMAKKIVDISSNAAASKSPSEEQNNRNNSPSSFKRIDFEIQTDQVEKSDFGVQENLNIQTQSIEITQTDWQGVELGTGSDSDQGFPSQSLQAHNPDDGVESGLIEDNSRTRISADIQVEFSSDGDTEEIVRDALGSESEDTDAEEVHQEYDAIMSKPIVKAKLITTSQTGSSSDTDHSDSSTAKEEDSEEEEAEEELRETLKEDIIGTIHEITANDFKELMTVYRDQRNSFKNLRDHERQRHQGSLWEILEERRRRTDKHIHDGEHHEDGTEQNGEEKLPENEATGSSADDEEQNDVEESMHRAEELNQTIQEMDLEIVRQACENNNRDVADKILEKHFELVEKMRRDKEESLAMHREKMMRRLEGKHRKGDISSTSSDDSCNIENTCKKDDYISGEMDYLTQTYLQIIKSKQDIDEQQLYDLLLQYREEQQDLIRQREYEKLRMQEKLKERLKRRQQKSRQKKETESSSDEDDKIKVNRDESDMDEAFYDKMVQKYKNGELDEDQLSYMLDQHLREVEEFKKNLREMLAKRRKGHRQHPSESMKLKMLDDMVDEKNRAAEQIRHLRHIEKEKADKKLEEKMKKKKVVPYVETPDLPPPKRPGRKQQRTTEQSHISMNYENVEYDV